MAIERNEVNDALDFLRARKFAGEAALLEIARDRFPDLKLRLLHSGSLAVWDRDDDDGVVEAYCVTIAPIQ